MWKKISDSRWFYIVVSLLLAFVLWLYVSNDVNPIDTGTLRNVQVVFSGAEKLEERALMISEGDSQTVSLTLRARRDVLNRINAEGRTVLLVEQNAYAALSIADYAYILEVGSVVLEGPGKEMLANPKVKEAYLGG